MQIIDHILPTMATCLISQASGQGSTDDAGQSYLPIKLNLASNILRQVGCCYVKGWQKRQKHVQWITMIPSECKECFWCIAFDLCRRLGGDGELPGVDIHLAHGLYFSSFML